MLVLVQMAFRNLLQAPRRSAVMGSLVALVSAVLILLLAISEGLEQNILRAATQLQSGHITITGFYKPAPSEVVQMVVGVDEIHAILDDAPEIDYVAERYNGWVKLVSDRASLQMPLIGVDGAREVALLELLELAPESAYLAEGSDERKGDLSVIEERGNILLFAAQARKLQVEVGDTIVVQADALGGQVNTIDLTVGAIAQDMGMMTDWMTVCNIQDLIELYQYRTDSAGAFYVYLHDIEQAPEVMDRLRDEFRDAGHFVLAHDPNGWWSKLGRLSAEPWTGQGLDFTVWYEEVSWASFVVVLFDGLAWSITVVLIAVIGAGVTNVMWTTVRERSRELGTLRAIGMTRGWVLALVFLEATLLGLFSTTLGALLGAALALGIDAAGVPIPDPTMRMLLVSNTVQMTVSPGAIVSAIVGLTTFVGLAALPPAIQAARVRPIVAMQHAG